MRFLSLALLVLAVGCGAPPANVVDSGEMIIPDGGEKPDSGVIPDAGQPIPDAGQPDAGKPDAGEPGLPLLGNFSHELNNVEITLVAGPSEGLSKPRDVAINPASPKDVWIANYSDNAIVIIKGFGTATQSKAKHNGPGSEHFLPRPSGLAFGAANRMATAHDEDRPTQASTPGDFMGPTLWTTDALFEGGHASHMDMLHNSPSAVGIAWDRLNVYWVFDGAHSSITRYDFAADHGPAGTDHSDGVIQRCVQGQVSSSPGIASGLELDRSSKLLYIADSGNRRIAVMNTASLPAGTNLAPNYDGATQQLMSGMMLTTLTSSTTGPLRRPSGIALRNGLLYVSDNETSRIYAFDLTGKVIDWLDLSPIVKTGGLMGLDFDADGKLFVVDGLDSRVLRISSKI